MESNEQGRVHWGIDQGDVVAWAQGYQGPKFHALLTDAPYHLQSIHKRFGAEGAAPAKFGTDGVYARASRGFMGQQWDGGDVAFRSETWAAIRTNLLPGAFGLAFASSRGWHRMAVAIEDGGFILHPSLFFLYVYGSGFPKATNVSKQLARSKIAGSFADIWQGHRYGSQALKPAVEPILMFQNPYGGRPIENISGSGAGALNIEAGRIGTNGRPLREDITYSGSSLEGRVDGSLRTSRAVGQTEQGRWPANLVLQHGPNCQIVGYQDAPPYTINRWEDDAHPFGGGAGNDYHSVQAGGGRVPIWECEAGCPAGALGAQGEASRYFFQADQRLDEIDPFFYTTKASPLERNLGVMSGNPHPTLKSLALTHYLAGLLLPPGAYAPRRIFIPFSGAGSEMIGATLAGWEYVQGVELTPEYIPIAESRLAFWRSEMGRLNTNDPREILKAHGKDRAKARRVVSGNNPVQLDIFSEGNGG